MWIMVKEEKVHLKRDLQNNIPNNLFNITY